MTIPKLGRLNPVALREAWPHEAGSFTPWLAQCENLQILGDAIGIEMECEAQEQPVGSFSADLLCREISSERLILIENQIERTDHNHLGQILTYAAGLKVSTVIWVASTFREEHRAALDWLNEITSDDMSFIGVEVQLWQIGDSVPAPRFNIVSKPNNWSREIRENAREAVELTEGKILQREYWTAFMAFMDSKDYKNTPKPLAQNWMNFPIGRSGARLSVVASAYNNELQTYETGELRVELVLDSNAAALQFAVLEQQKIQLNSAVAPDALQWYNKDGVKMKRLFLSRAAQISNQSDWPEQHEWLYSRLMKFNKVFKSIVAELPRN